MPTNTYSPSPFSFTVGMRGKTRGGRDYEILKIDNKSSGGPIVAITHDIKNDEWKPDCYFASGKFVKERETEWDLLLPRRHFRFERWVNIYPMHIGSIDNKTRNEADDAAFHANRIACILITIEGDEGDGL